MSLTKAILVLVSFALLTANVGCAKKSSKRVSAAPAPQGSSTPTDGGLDGDEPTGDQQAPPVGTPVGDNNMDDGDGSDMTPIDQGAIKPIDNEPTTAENPDGKVTLTQGDGLDEVINHPDVTNVDQGPSRNQECGTAYRRHSEQWFPGLPYPPAQKRICTGGKIGEVSDDNLMKCDPGTGYVFTDSRQDALMALAVDRFNKIPNALQHGSRELAESLRDFKVSADIYKTGKVKLQFAIATGKDKYETFTLKGTMSNWRGKDRTDVTLGKVKKAGMTFSAVLTCADLQIGCQNAIVRLQQHGRSGKVKRAAYIVHRWGDAHVTISDKDLKHYNQIESDNYRAFAKYMSNTANNNCLVILGEVQNGTRQMPECAQRRLLAQCGRKQWESNAAKVFDFRSWAAAYGRSGFEFAMIDQGGLYDFEAQSEPRLRIRGPLIASNSLPVWGRPLNVDGSAAAGISNVALVSNDGGGNLNLQVDFKGQTKSYTRVSITTLIEDNRYSSEGMVHGAGQMPGLDESQCELVEEAPPTEGLPKPPQDPVEPPVEQKTQADMG
jgi:hypothetical protein